jgi:hypothetical protein
MGKKLKNAAKIAGGIAVGALVGAAIYTATKNTNPFAELHASMSRRAQIQQFMRVDRDVRRRSDYNRLRSMGEYLVSGLRKPKVQPYIGENKYQTMEGAFGFDWN